PGRGASAGSTPSGASVADPSDSFGDGGSGEPPPAPMDAPPPPGAPAPPPASPSEVGATGRVVTLAVARGAEGSPTGRRSTAIGTRGRVVAARPMLPGDGRAGDVAVGATVRAAMVRAGEAPVKVEPDDLRRAVREQRTGNLVVLAVDASASMGALRRMAAVKGAVVSLLLDAYQRRDRVALVTFAGEVAHVALQPTASVEVARARLAELGTGGATPLAAGIDTALDVARRPGGPQVPLLVLVSDGRATAAPSGEDPLDAARRAAARVHEAGVAAVLVDVEEGSTRLGLAGELANLMGAVHLTLPELTGEGLAGGIRRITLGG
ncbi:MAG: VWA domain-containing protein, partial [Acidimicrobiales bacterium]